MKITVNENHNFIETEVIINCQKADEQVLRICTSLQMLDKKVVGSHRGQAHILNASDILYAETVDRKTFIYTQEQVYDSSMS